MSAAGSPTRDGSGNGNPPRRNPVDVDDELYQWCCADIERRWPRLAQDEFFRFLRLLMVILNVEREARQLGGGGETWVLTTPDDMEPCLAIYFSYAAGAIVMRAVHDRS